MSARRARRIGIAVESSLWGGLEAHSVDLAGVIASRGHHPVIVCSNAHTSDLFRTSTKFDIVTIPPFGTSSVSTLARAFRSLSLDACVLEKGTLHSGSLGFDIAARLGCRHYIAIQQLSPPELPPPSTRRRLGLPSPNLWRRRMVWRGWIRSVLPHATVCVSDAVAVALRDDYRFPVRKLVTVRNGVDVDRFRDDPVAAKRLRAEWDVPESAIVFGTVCRLVPEKGVDVCLEAFRRLSTVTQPMYLVVVGDGPERQALESMAVRLRLRERVRFAGFRTDVPAVLSALDVLVLSSRMEGLPLIVAESLAVGRPVIASRVAGTPEIITRDDVGWLIRPGDVDELAQVMQQAGTRTPEQVAQMRDAARQHAVQRFSAVENYSKIAALVEPD